MPPTTGIDGRLVLGALLFGVGWGLSGYCPGPAIASLSSPYGGVAAFVVAMLAMLRLLPMGLFGAFLGAFAERFDTAINNMSHGLCFFDEDQRLITCNRRYSELYPLAGGVPRPGTNLLTLLESQVAALVARARAAQPAWEALGFEERAKVLRRDVAATRALSTPSSSRNRRPEGGGPVGRPAPAPPGARRPPPGR